MNREQKQRARGATRRAIESGKLVKPDACEKCGEKPDGPIHTHHPDYSKPLKVDFLCAPCHRDEHRASSTPFARLLREAGLSQAQLARDIGVSPITVCRWVSGGRPIKIYQRVLAEWFRINPEEIWE